MPLETLLGLSPTDGEKPEMHSEVVTHYNDEGDPISEGEVFYYKDQGVKFVTKMDGCDADDLWVHFTGEWTFEN